MIKTVVDLKYYKKEDKIALGVSNSFFEAIRHFSSLEMWRFEKTLRNLEYCINKKWHFASLLFRLRLFSLGRKLDLCIPPNVFGPGLALVHHCINVNANAKIGKNCRILTGCVIGTTNGLEGAPQIGDNVFLGAGAKIIGKVRIASDVAIGANSVVVKDIVDEGTTWAGIPAKKISQKNSHANLDPRLFQDD